MSINYSEGQKVKSVRANLAREGRDYSCQLRRAASSIRGGHLTGNVRVLSAGQKYGTSVAVRTTGSD